MSDEVKHIEEALKLERGILSTIRGRANYYINTTQFSPSQLRTRLNEIFSKSHNGGLMTVHFVSFGFKYGLPSDADLVFDVRCFPNPYWVEELRPLTGLDEPVKSYLYRHVVINEFLRRLYDMIDFLLPQYVQEGKSQLTVAIGCTGGKHRSVAFAEALGSHLRSRGANAVVQHRDIVKKFVGDK